MEMRAGNGKLGMSYRAPKAGALPGCATPPLLVLKYFLIGVLAQPERLC